VLLQQVIADETLTLPVWAMGGIGPRTAVACVIGGAAGVVLDSQLSLMPESDLPGDIRRLLRRVDGMETVEAAGQHGIKVTGAPARLARPWDTETVLLPVGQDGQLAALFSDRWPDTAAAVRGLRSAILDAVANSEAVYPLSPGAPLAADLSVRVPVAQGPMTRVSDQPGFAAAVAADGAMPFIALALADGERSRHMLEAAAAALDGQPWGVGVLGFVPDELRVAQLAAVLQAKPSWVIMAGGRPAQAKELEQAGIATFLHVPSPVLLGQFLRSGSRRFVFEGAECGGHIGPRASFPLWESQLAVIDDYLDEGPADAAAELQVLFAGGIHDARSAAMVAAMAGPLTRRGVRFGVLMGTSYLFTREAVEHGAVKPLFQQMVLGAAETALLETSPGHMTRALRTPFVAEFARRRSELEAAGLESGEVWAQLELLNIGRLRLASKGMEHDGTEIDERTQEAEGLYMAGQVAVLRDRVTTVPALHADVTSGARDFYRMRIAELQRKSATATDKADNADESPKPLDIAVIGMAGVFPGSPDLDGFWRLILSGQDAFTEVPPERWDTSIFYTSDLMEGNSGRRTVSKWGGFLPPVVIDPIRHGIPPSALGSIDPSQLLALEIANRALNDAGYPCDAPGADHSRTGVIFAAEPGSDDGGGLGLRALLPAYLGELPPEFDEQLPTYTEDTFPGHLANVVAGRIANRLNLTGKSPTPAECAAANPSPQAPGRFARPVMSCGRRQRDGVPERFELADVVAGLLLLVDSLVVVARAQVVVAGRGAGQQVPDDDQDGAGNRDEGFEFAAPFDDPPVALTEEGVGFGGRCGYLAEDAFEVGVALAGLAGAAAGTGLDGARAQLGPRHQVPGGREPGHIQADLGEDDLGAVTADAGDLIEAGDGIGPGRIRAGASARAGGAVGVDALRGGNRCDQLPDPGGELGDLPVERVDLVQQHPGQLAVMIVEPPRERLDQRAMLGLHPAAGQAGQHFRVPFSGDQRLQHVPDRHRVQAAGHSRDLDQRVFQQLLQPLPVPGALPGQIDAQPGVIPQPPDLGGRDEAGPQHPPLGQLRLPDTVKLVRLRPARSVLDVPGVD